MDVQEKTRISTITQEQGSLDLGADILVRTTAKGVAIDPTCINIGKLERT